MQQIKKKFKVCYDEKNSPLKLQQFITFEMALMVATYFKAGADPAKGYIFFTKYQNIQRKGSGRNFYLIQNASVYLKKYRSEKVWSDTLEKYQRKEYDGIRLFEITEERIVKCDTENLPYGNREEDYWRYLLAKRKSVERKYATNGDYSYYNRNNEQKKIYVSIHEDMMNDADEGKQQNEKDDKVTDQVLPREKIVLSVSDMLATAEEIHKKKENDYCLGVLKSNLIKEVNSGKVKQAEFLKLNQVTNIVGMVGAGKSTLLKVIAYMLDKMGKKVVIVTDTVAEVFKLYGYFQELDCNCSPLIGRTERIKYINQMLDEDAYYLGENLSKYLTTNCLIDGMDVTSENAVSFGEEPCAKLECGGKRFICPYFDKCPTTSMQRDAMEKNIVITTVAGMVMSKVGIQQNIFLKEIMEKADVVFYDECDRIQKNLDELFVPAVKFNDFIMEVSESCRQFMCKSNRERMDYIEDTHYKELQLKSPTVLVCVSNAVKSVREYGGRNILSDAFSAYTMLEKMKEEISQTTQDEIYKLMDVSKAEQSSLYDIMEKSCESVITDRFETLLGIWLDQNEPELVWEGTAQLSGKHPGKNEKELRDIQKKIERQNKKRIEIRKKIQLILTLIAFDRHIRNIGNAFENVYEDSPNSENSNNDLTGFIQTRFRLQQDYLPSALLGNLFGIKLTDEDDILLFRQYAYGRVLLTDLPGLRVNEKGVSTGPHVVLMSGSSYAKGSYEYHVNAEINYILEAGENIRDFISRTHFVELGLAERVSGSPLESREEILKKVVDKCTPNVVSELEKEGKILLVVNSFRQTRIVAERLRRNLINRKCGENVCELISDKSSISGESENYIRRGEVYRFDQRKARILVAPALAIERGHNIVDERGHSSLNSVFFLLRPMGIPDDVKEKSIKLNGYMADKLYDYPYTDAYEKNLYVRREAAKFWVRMNRTSKERLDNLEDVEIKRDLVSTMFVLILQIFGRLCRITDASRNPPTVYFADGAFRKRDGAEKGFDTLNEIYEYLNEMLSDPENGEIARTLYEPFFTAYKGDIRHE